MLLILLLEVGPNLSLLVQTPIFEPEKWENNVDSLWSNEEGWKGPKPLMMAGIFDTWKSPENGASVYSYSIITMDSSPSFASIHERMPAILHNEEEIEEWLNYVKFPAALAISKLKASSNLLSHPVSTGIILLCIIFAQQKMEYILQQ